LTGLRQPVKCGLIAPITPIRLPRHLSVCATVITQHIAAVLYATLETDAVTDEGSTPDMQLELFCHRDNGRGIAFWERMGYTVIESETGHDYVRMRR
jgi:hypothetical protein